MAFVVAHPDDDVMGASGLMALHRDDQDLRFVLVHATDGEAGQIAPGSGATRATLGKVRREEDRRGWDVVGRQPERHEWLALPDGGLADLEPGLLADRIARILGDERPDVVCTFGPDGITGHPDHIAVGAATTEAFHRFVDQTGPGFRRLFHAALPQRAARFLERWNARLAVEGKRTLDPDDPLHPRPVSDADIACTIDQRAVADVVKAAFLEHRTQWAWPWTEYNHAEWRQATGATHLVQAWPRREPDAPMLRDPLEGLAPDARAGGDGARTSVLPAG
jgi:N-acetyl-1-D-myo-inositol-2-amino-2-deoxy-alpha-D-glucopyranoside deacetylase